ncbi:hypothetical protein Tco_0493418 [Tanacetum coccineum]
MASMNTRLNIKNLNENSVQKHEGSNKLGLSNLVLVLKQVSMEYMFKSVFSLRWNCKELKVIVKLRVPGQEGVEGSVAGRNKMSYKEAKLGNLLKYKAWLTRRSPVRGSSIDEDVEYR